MVNAEDIINIAKAEIGTKESPPNSNNVKYNTWYYGHPVSGSSYPWCAVFVSWCFRDNLDLIKKSASCTTMMNWFKQNGKYQTLPQVGDLVFFNFDKTPDKNIAKHIGIVIAVNSDSVITIEGNTSAGSSGSQDNGGMVAQRTRKFGKSIVGYGRPAYSSVPQPTPTTRPTLRFGDKGPDVQYLHQRLRTFYYNVSAESDYFDSTTKLCVINFQASNLLVPDGVVGPMTWRVLG